jgi:hypothetical protein
VISKAKFDEVTNIERARAGEIEKIHAQLHSAHKEQATLRTQLKASKKATREAKQDGILAGQRQERGRAERLVQGRDKEITKLKAAIEHLKKGTTPQTGGLEFEETLYRRLRQYFPDDDIRWEGKGGDVLHSVVFKGEAAGLIVYECKQTPDIRRGHIEQAARNKRVRQAHFAILVHSGTRKGFTGLAHENNVLIVAPLGVLALAELCRGHLIEMAKAKLDQKRRMEIAGKLLDYILSPECKIPLEEVIHKAQRARDVLMKEIKDHVRVWGERNELYQSIGWDASFVQGNMTRVLSGEKALALTRTRSKPLLLPAVSSR